MWETQQEEAEQNKSPEKGGHENIHLRKSTSSCWTVTTTPWRRQGPCHYSHFEVRKPELVEGLSDSSSIHRLCHQLQQKTLGCGLDSKPGAALCLCGLPEEGKTVQFRSDITRAVAEVGATYPVPG